MIPTPPLSFTHLVPEEKVIAQLFIEQNLINASAWIFDEHLGDGMTPDPSWPSWLAAMSKTLTQRRVDLVGLTPSDTYLIELKQRGNIHAIGQLLVYESLYRIKYPTTTRLHLALVCRYMGFDLTVALNKYNILWFVV